MDITGNKKAEEEAKRAALEQITGEPLTQYKLKSAQTTKINNDINTAVRKAWNSGKTNARQHRKMMTQPQRFKTGEQLYGGLPRKQLANLIRLRTGHCRLNSYLNRHRIIEDPTCESGHRVETVKHFLLMCKKYEEPRNKLRKKVRWRNMRTGNLLGDPKLVMDRLEFVEETGSVLNIEQRM